MSELWLIAHKVRGEAAFDVAQKMECPECKGQGETGGHPDHPMRPCAECDSTGFWWVVPTSGHRAYAWRWWPLFDLHCEGPEAIDPQWEIQNGIPEDWPDHYSHHAQRKLDLTALLPKAPVYRRY